ncbi:glutathione S-transferase family protein [Pseudotabrizicola algicola]|uniref:Glutathione S-transferase family protein n=1 Tax=Pseudotabrizicola algicola TaxID=2709381 RepID=A0A6B3RQP9_9RHOB|nr:glutathione S-transferase family protein [Pseudotabrizicola algicola]NEX47583.1 glutathione S-transferase family protein [Pseudotabrizicola algicola]
MTVQLYCFGESGNAYKCALALVFSDTPWQARYVDFFNGETRTAAYRALNPMGEVPVLVSGDEVLTQSGSILMHIAAQTGKLGGSTKQEQAEILRWILWDNHKLSTQIGTVRFLMNFLPAEKRPEGVVPFLQGRLKAAYTVLNDHLAARDWVVGDGPTIADLSCCGYLYYPEPFGFDRKDWPHIDAWLDRISALPGWKHPYELMPGSPADRT